MTKKILSVFSVLFAALISMSGCMEEAIEEDDRNNIIDALSDEDIIPENWEFVDYERNCDWFLPTGDALGYDYIYKDENEKYYTVYMTDLSYEEDIYYGDNEISIKGGETYYLIEVSECDLSIETETFSYGNSYTTNSINTNNYDCEKYILYYDKFLFIQTDDLVVEPVIYYDEEETQTEETL